MNLEKFKICPWCGTRNLPTALECTECETDLSTIRIVDEETKKSAEETEKQPALISQSKIRICEGCGNSNPANARKCVSCGEDLSDVIPTDASVEASGHFILTSIDGEYAYQLQQGKTVVGREALMSDFLKQRLFVSRKQAEFELEGMRITLKNLSATNFTYVNNQKITNEIIELHDGDEIGLGGKEQNGKRQDQAAYFILRINTCI